MALLVADQDQAVQFHVDKFGFEVRRDVPMANGERSIQVAPAGAATTIALVLTGEVLPVGLKTEITLTTSDAGADHGGLGARGVQVKELLRWPGVPPMFAFRDQDGNELKIIEMSWGRSVAGGEDLAAE